MSRGAAITIRSDLRPGDLGRIIALHGTAYEAERGHFGLPFEAHVARTVAEFVLDNGARGRVFLVERGTDLVGCAAIVERRGPAGVLGQLRWVLADPSVRGRGLGKKLVSMAIDHARAAGWREVFLETTDGLDASMSIYKALGFVIASQEIREMWSRETNLFTMRLTLR